jgi:DEAD/DEAH box helicase domain-containing protein
MNYITFDIETYSDEPLAKIDTDKFKVSVCGAYLSWTKEYIAFFESDIQDFLNLLREVDLVVGFNQIWFDLPVLQKYSTFDLKKLTNYDILLEFQNKAGFKPKLDDLAKATLGTAKTDSYHTYKDYYHQQKMAELTDYCMNDVLITQKIFQKILDQKPIFYPDALGQKEFLLDQPTFKKAEIEEQPESIF